MWEKLLSGFGRVKGEIEIDADLLPHLSGKCNPPGDYLRMLGMSQRPERVRAGKTRVFDFRLTKGYAIDRARCEVGVSPVHRRNARKNEACSR